MCEKLLSIKSEPASSVSKSRRVDKQPFASESGSSLAVSSSRRRQHHMGKSSRKRPAEVFFYCILLPCSDSCSYGCLGLLRGTSAVQKTLLCKSFCVCILDSFC